MPHGQVHNQRLMTCGSWLRLSLRLVAYGLLLCSWFWLSGYLAVASAAACDWWLWQKGMQTAVWGYACGLQLLTLSVSLFLCFFFFLHRSSLLLRWWGWFFRLHFNLKYLPLVSLSLSLSFSFFLLFLSLSLSLSLARSLFLSLSPLSLSLVLFSLSLSLSFSLFPSPSFSLYEALFQ